MRIHTWNVQRRIFGFTVTALGLDFNLMLRTWRSRCYSYLNAIGNREKQISQEGIVFGIVAGLLGFSVVWEDADERFDEGTGYFIG